VALGQLKIAGKYIKRLVLADGPYLVLLDHPGEVVSVPTGSYSQLTARLENQGTEAYGKSSQTSASRKISVNAQTPAMLNLGGPLTNAVAVTRQGQDLRLDYQLIGAGGETYQLAGENRSQPPEFAVFQGVKQIASGAFEFG